MKKMVSFSKTVSYVMEIIMMVCMFMVLSMILVQIASRIFAIATTSWTDEILRFFMAYFVFIGSALLVQTKEHVQLDIIPGLFKGTIRKIWDIAVHLAVTAASIGMIYGGYRWIRGTSGFSPYLLIPFKYYYCIVPISFGFVIFFSVCHILEIVQGEDQGQRHQEGLPSD